MQNPITSACKAQPRLASLYAEGTAADARVQLARLGFYPTRDLVTDPARDTDEANIHDGCKAVYNRHTYTAVARSRRCWEAASPYSTAL